MINLKDLNGETRIVYFNDKSYSAFPCVLKLQNGEIIACFREAVRRERATHIDPTSRATIVRSKDNGKTWVKDCEILSGEEHIGIQDPSVMQLRDGTLLLSSFTWGCYKTETDAQNSGSRYYRASNVAGFSFAALLGTRIWSSTDNGKTWKSHKETIYKLPNSVCEATSEPIIEISDRVIILPMYGGVKEASSCYFMKSVDKGNSWTLLSSIPPAENGVVGVAEPTLLSLPNNKMLCLMRPSAKGDGHLYQSVSEDNGTSWSQAVKTNIWGYPANLLLLRNGWILSSYGYRRKPFGVQSCISKDNGETWDVENSIVLRDDGTGSDLGYPSSVQFDDGKILTLYYMHKDEVRHIAAAVYKLPE